MAVYAQHQKRKLIPWLWIHTDIPSPHYEVVEVHSAFGGQTAPLIYIFVLFPNCNNIGNLSIDIFLGSYPAFPGTRMITPN